MEPPSERHFGTSHFILSFVERLSSSQVKNESAIGKVSRSVVLYWEVVPFLEGLSLEVPEA